MQLAVVVSPRRFRFRAATPKPMWKQPTLVGEAHLRPGIRRETGIVLSSKAAEGVELIKERPDGSQGGSRGGSSQAP
jgi:hypothetical protein